MRLYVILHLCLKSGTTLAFYLATLISSHPGSSPAASSPTRWPCKLISVRQQGEDLDFGDNVDTATFEQILDMDEEPGDREFSQGIVFDFFSQAEGTFADMDTDM